MSDISQVSRVGCEIRRPSWREGPGPARTMVTLSGMIPASADAWSIPALSSREAGAEVSAMLSCVLP